MGVGVDDESPRQERMSESVDRAQHLGAQSYLQYCSTQSVVMSKR